MCFLSEVVAGEVVLQDLGVWDEVAVEVVHLSMPSVDSPAGEYNLEVEEEALRKVHEG